MKPKADNEARLFQIEARMSNSERAVGEDYKFVKDT